MSKRIARFTSTRPDQTFESFELRDVQAMIRRAYFGALAYAENLKGWLVLHGNCGTGRSHLASAVVNRRSDRLVMSLTVPRMLGMLRQGFDNGTYDNLLNLSHTVDLLVLDDMGAESPTDWTRQIQFLIINYRSNHQLPTIFILNGKPDDLEPRIASRINDRSLSSIYPMWGDDYRQRKDRGSTPRG